MPSNSSATDRRPSLASRLRRLAPRRPPGRSHRRADLDRPSRYRLRGAGRGDRRRPRPPQLVADAEPPARGRHREAQRGQGRPRAASRPRSRAPSRPPPTPQAQLAALDGQIRQLARTAYTERGALTHLDVLLTSDSADELLHQMGTLDAIAGHTNASRSPRSPQPPRRRSGPGRRRGGRGARRSRPSTRSRPSRRTSRRKIADYQRQYAALSAAAAGRRSGQAVAACGAVARPSPQRRRRPPARPRRSRSTRRWPRSATPTSGAPAARTPSTAPV